MQLEPIRTNEGSPGSVVLGRRISSEAQKVLRNTYLLLALTMVPTIAGAWLGMATASIITGSPIISFFVMLAAVIGLQFGIARFRNSAIGIALLLLMTFLLGWFLGPLLNYALALKNGMQLVGYDGLPPGAVIVRSRSLEVRGQGMEISVGPQQLRLLGDVHTTVRSDAETS